MEKREALVIVIVLALLLFLNDWEKTGLVNYGGNPAIKRGDKGDPREFLTSPQAQGTYNPGIRINPLAEKEKPWTMLSKGYLYCSCEKDEDCLKPRCPTLSRAVCDTKLHLCKPVRP